MKNNMSSSYLSRGTYWINFTAPLTCPHRGTTFHMDLMKPQENPCLQGKHTELGIDFVLLTMAARLMRSLFSLAKNIMHKRIWCWKLLPSACMTKAFYAMLWMICNVMELLLAMEVTNTICKKYSTHKLAGNTGVTMSSVSIKYHLATEPSTPEREEVSNVELMEQLQDNLTMEKMVSKGPLLPSCTNPFICSMIYQPSDDEDASSTSVESGFEWETEDDGLGWEKEESSSTEMSTDSGLQEFWTPVSKAEDGEETREDDESDWSDSDSWDTDSNPDSKVDEDLWASFCQNDDPYNPFCFSMPTKGPKKSLDMLDANTTNLGVFDGDKLSGTDLEMQEPGCAKRVRFSPEITVFSLPEEDENERKGPWEEYARDRCRFQKRIKETGDAISYCLEPKSDEGSFLTGDDIATSSDEVLAQMLQMQFDREYDAQLLREERKFNGDSKVCISFENYRKVHPYEESDSSGDEVDWQDTRHDPYKADKPTPTPKKGFIGKGKDITTKHDEVVCGRKNTARMENFAPEFQVGDGIGMDLKLSNQVFNALKQHSISEQRRSARLHDKKEVSTAEKAVDPKTRLLLYKMVNAGTLDTINGCVSTGKESVVFHATGGRLEDQEVPSECALKVFKTTLNEFKNRDKYIKDDYRFKDRFSKLNPRKIIRMWAEKEKHNLKRMQKAGIPCPEVVLLKKHVLVMSFIGKDQVPAPTLKEAKLGLEDSIQAYHEVLSMMKRLYDECNLVHADLSEYNMLWHDGKVWLIDVSQSVEPTHPHGLEFLYRDCRNVSQFFQKAGVTETPNERELFNIVSGLNITSDNQADFLAEIEALEKLNESHVQNHGKKISAFHKDDEGPPRIYDE